MTLNEHKIRYLSNVYRRKTFPVILHHPVSVTGLITNSARLCIFFPNIPIPALAKIRINAFQDYSCDLANIFGSTLYINELALQPQHFRPGIQSRQETGSCFPGKNKYQHDVVSNFQMLLNN